MMMMFRNPQRLTYAAFLLLQLTTTTTALNGDVVAAVAVPQQPQQGMVSESHSLDNLEASTTMEQAPPQQRRQLFWSLVFLADLLHHPPCPPIGPAHDKCVASRSEESTDSDGSSSTTAASSSSESTVTGMDRGGIPSGVSRFQLFMLIAAAMAVMMAIMAIIAGQRKQEKQPHVLTGSVARRMALFSNFCNSALCDSVDRPSRVVEMTMSVDDYDTLHEPETTNRHSAMV